MVKITKKQISLLNDVFNWALNLLEDATKDSCIFEPDENGEYQQLDVEKKTQEIYDLAEYLQSNFNIVE